MYEIPLCLPTELGGVRLERLIPEHANALFRLIDRNRNHLSRSGDVTACKYPDEESVLKSIRHPVSLGRLRMGIWHNEELVGTVNLQNLPAPYYAEIGYWLGEEYTGHGFMAAAVRAMVLYAFEETDYRWLTANARKENSRSRAVLERVGFRITSEADVYVNYKLLRDAGQ